MAKNAKPISVVLPGQLNVMIDAVAMFGNGKFPGPSGHIPESTNKKDVMGYMLFKGCYTFLKENGFLDAVERGYTMHGEKFNHKMYNAGEAIAKEKEEEVAADMLAGIDATPEV